MFPRIAATLTPVTLPRKTLIYRPVGRSENMPRAAFDLGCSVSSAFPRMLPMLQHTYGCHSPRVTNGNNGVLGWRFVLVLATLPSQPVAEYAPLQRGRMRSKSLFPGRVLPENSG